jgi:uncharacterized protein
MVRSRFCYWLIGLLAVLGCLAALAPAQAQYRDDRYQFLRRQSQHSGGFFFDLFGGGAQRQQDRERNPFAAPPQAPREHVDYSHAPPPRKPEMTQDVPPPTTTIVVMGDGMADWLAYGLEDAFADSPEVAIVRQDKPRSGLIRYEWHSDLDWWHVARDDLAKDKANYVVMMLGVSDRQNISERDVAKEAEKDQKDQKDQKAQNQNGQGPNGQDKNGQDQNAPNQDQADNPDQLIAAPTTKYPHGIIPFRSDRWAEVYSHRIDQTIAALKSKGVPVFWVGLPSIRGTRSTADAVYLNDLYRARAERAGVDYIDIWDGFVDDAGKYSNYGPDYEGQTRRLRSYDGVYFTKYGARKLAHYVEREIRRYMSNRAVVSLPTGPIQPLPNAGKSKVRPLAGPVVPLTVAPTTADTLAGGPGMHSTLGDAVATKVLLNGDALGAVPGRADDFAWPPGGDAKHQPATASAPPAPAATVANAAPTAPAVAPRAPAAKPNAPVPTQAGKPAPVKKPAEAKKPVEIKKPEQAKKPQEAKKPAARKREPTERTAQSRTTRPTFLPPGLIPTGR